MRTSAIFVVGLLSFFVSSANAQEPIKDIKEWILLDAKETVNAIALSHDGKMMAVASGTSQFGDRIRVWNLTDQSVMCLIQARRGTMRFTNKETELAVVSYYKNDDKRELKVRTFHVRNGENKNETRVDEDRGLFTGVSLDAKVLITSPTIEASKIAHVWDLNTMKKITLEADGFFWRTSYICPQNKTIVTFHPYETRIWDYPSGKLRHKMPRKDSVLWSNDPFKLSFAGDGKSFHLCYPKGFVTIWDAFTGKLRSEKPWFIEGSYRFALLPEGKHLVANYVNSEEKGHGSDLTVFDIENRGPIARLRGTNRVMNLADLAISADGTVAAQSTSTGTISVWKLPKLEQ